MSRPFTFYVIQSAHTDIGYTHPQEQILLMYLEHYDRVLELCRDTQFAPEERRFKWTCETAWQVKHYLEQRPERLEEFLNCVRRGQIEITASYLHFADVIDAPALRDSLGWVVSFCQRHDLPLRSALHCDVNGWGWALADLLAEAGVRYFLSQVHLDSATDPLGQRGSVHYHWRFDPGVSWMLREDTPTRMPQAFWWQGPAGGRVLHWLGEHYHLGNALGVSSFKMFGADKTRFFLESDTLTTEVLLERAEREVPRYLEHLKRCGYDHEVGLLSTGGYFVDNAPPDGRWCEVIERFNATNQQIQLRTATVAEFFAALEASATRDWPTWQVAWPDHWAHGLGANVRRIAQARRTQRRRQDALALTARGSFPQSKSHSETALEQERLSLEHTFDAWSTTERVGATQNDFQQAAKELTFHRAELYLDESIGAALRQEQRVSGAHLALHVPSARLHPHPSRTLHFDLGDGEFDADATALESPDGASMRFQADHVGLRQFVAVVQPHATAALALRPVAAARRPSGNPGPSHTLESAHWSLTLDPISGGLSSLQDRHAGREWVRANAPHGFGQLVHESVIHPLGRVATHNLARLVALGVASEQATAALGDQPIFERRAPNATRPVCRVEGAVFDALVWHGHSPAIGSVEAAWRVYHDLPLVELVIDWDKQWSDLPEAAYVAFGFDAVGGRLELETAGGLFRPGSHGVGGQLPGTCSSYYTVQRGAQITAPDGAKLVWSPLDAPLVMPNEINFNRWETDPYDWNGFLASMPVNHYWHTNFPTSQRGNLRLRYRFCPVQGFTSDDAFALTQPLEALGWR